MRGMLHAARGNLDQAIAEMNEAIRLDPKNLGVYFARYFVQILRHDSRSALAGLEEAMSLDPESQDRIRLAQMMLLSAIGELDSALGIADQLVSNWLLKWASDDPLQRDSVTSQQDQYFGETSSPTPKQQRDVGRPEPWAIWTRLSRSSGTPKRANILIDKKEFDKAKDDCVYGRSLPMIARNADASIYRAKIWIQKHEYAKSPRRSRPSARLPGQDDVADAHRAYRAWILASCPDDTIRNGRSRPRLRSSTPSRLRRPSAG